MIFLIVYLVIGFMICRSLDGEHPLGEAIVSLLWPISIAYVIWEDYQIKKNGDNEDE